MSREIAQKCLMDGLSQNEQFLIEEIQTLPERLIDCMIEYHKQVKNNVALADVSSSAIERAKIVATKRLKMVVDTAIHEYEKAEKNGRCDECQEPLTFLEAKDGKTCEDCLCPE